MIEYASRSRPAARDHVDVVGFLRRLDWILLFAVGAVVAYGLWAVAGITRFDVEGDENYYVVRQAIAAGLGFAGFLVVLADRPRPLPPRAEGDLRRHARRDAARLPARRRDARLEAVDRDRPVPVPAVRVREAALRARARRLPRRPGAAPARARGSCCRRSGWRRSRSRSSSSSPTSARRSSSGRRSSPACSSPGSAGATSRLLVGVVALLASSVVWFLPAAGVEVLEPYQAARLNFTNLEEDPGGAAYNQTQSITAVGSGGLDGRGVAGGDADAARLPPRAPHRLRLRRARGAAGLLRRRAPARPLPADRLARPPGDHGRARRVLRDRRRRDRDRPSSSRSSSTSG